MSKVKLIIGYDDQTIFRDLKYEVLHGGGGISLYELALERERKRRDALPRPVQLMLPFEGGPGEENTSGHAA